MASDFRVVFRSEDRSLRCRAWLGDTPPTPSGGGGGHEIVPLPGRRPVLVWRQADLVVMSISILIDDFVAGDPVAGEYGQLVRMYRPLREVAEPPPIKVECDGDSVPFSHLTWRVTDLEWGEALANDDGHRTRQGFVVTLTEDNPEQRIDAQASGSGAKRREQKRNQGKGTDRPSTHTVRALGAPGVLVAALPETLTDIAAHYKIKGGWRAIGEIQRPPIRDPRGVQVGQVLTLP